MRKLLFCAIFMTLSFATNGFERMPLNDFFRKQDPNRAKLPSVMPKSTVLNSLVQHVDNFNIQNTATFEQRYFQNGEFFQPGGPIFLFLAGEWEITPFPLMDSLMTEMANEMKGYMFYLEHRFYGKSFPTSNASTPNLRFLTVDQALADIAHFVTYIKSTYVTPGAENSPVIVIGSHYSASLAVWFRQKYPHLALAAWASSAPVLAKVDHSEFKEIAGAVYRQVGGNSCYNRIETGFKFMEKMIADGKNKELSEIFGLCDSLEDQLDIWMFFNFVSEFYSILAQYSQIIPINEVCTIVQDESAESPAHSIAKIMQILVSDECFSIKYDYFVQGDSEVELDAAAVVNGIRQWSYQACSQLGWFHTSSSQFQPFGSSFPIELYYNICQDVFGDRFLKNSVNTNIDRYNTIYGGLNPEVTNVVFTHGQHDPWRTVGIQDDLNESAPVFIIEDASQSNDLGSISEDDSPQTVAIKLKIKDLIHYWIARDAGIGIIPL